MLRVRPVKFEEFSREWRFLVKNLFVHLATITIYIVLISHFISLSITLTHSFTGTTHPSQQPAGKYRSSVTGGSSGAFVLESSCCSSVSAQPLCCFSLHCTGGDTDEPYDKCLAFVEEHGITEAHSTSCSPTQSLRPC